MRNRIPDFLPTSNQPDQSSSPTFQELSDLARMQFAGKLRQGETYVREHPASGLRAAFCMGLFLGWVIKRK